MYGEYIQVHFVVLLLYIIFESFHNTSYKTVVLLKKTNRTVASRECRSRKFGIFLNDFFF